MTAPRRIAFLSQGAKNWVAGTIYIHNLVRALHCLPVRERPQLHTILGPAQHDRDNKELGWMKPRAYYYCCRTESSLDDKIRESRQSLLKGRWPASLEQLAIKINPDVIFPVQGWSLGRNFPAPWVGWIPDFQHKHLPHFFTDKEKHERDRTYERLIRDCGHLVLSSQEAYKDLVRWYGIPVDKVSVLPFTSVATRVWYAGNPAETVAEYKLPAKFLMFPSQFWVHKNHLTVFKALALLKKRGLGNIDLVCTGFTEDYRKPEHFPMLKAFIREQGIEANIHILGLLPRAKQMHLMRAAAAIVQPSLFEGWSSLVEDARTLGKSIFLSDIPIHREQDPPDAFYFEPENSENLAALIALQWPALTAGPDYAGEETAKLAQTARAQAVARSFLGIVDRTVRGASHRGFTYPQENIIHI